LNLKPTDQQLIQWQHYLLVGLAFFIPFFPRIVPLLISVLFVLSAYSFFRFRKQFVLNEVAILMAIYYGLYCLGLSFTENIDRGLFDLEVKLSLLAFPLIFLVVQPLNKTVFERILRSFMYGTFAQAVVSLLRSTWAFAETGDQNSFFVKEFSQLLHPNYFSLYLVFSIVILCFLQWPKIKTGLSAKQFVTMLAILFACVCVILTGSKSGLIMLLGTAFVIVVYLVRDMKHKWMPIVGALVLTSLLGTIIEQSPVLKSRLQSALDIVSIETLQPTTNESTATRVLIYKTGWNLAITQPWYGQGTGDFQDAMDVQYHKQGFTFPLERHLNAHNAFLQTWISLGIPGLVMFIGLFIVMLNQSLRAGQRTYFAFLALFAMISMTESSMNVQAGVVFFSFFALLFSYRATIEEVENG